jgi:hypothetical protein
MHKVKRKPAKKQTTETILNSNVFAQSYTKHYPVSKPSRRITSPSEGKSPKRQRIYSPFSASLSVKKVTSSVKGKSPKRNLFCLPLPSVSPIECPSTSPLSDSYRDDLESSNKDRHAMYSVDKIERAWIRTSSLLQTWLKRIFLYTICR